MDASQIGKRAWNYAGVLRDDGLSCFEYVEQLTLLLFLKMADQLTEPPYEREPLVPPEVGWRALLPLDGGALEDQYRKSLEKLGAERGMLGVIFRGARCEIRNPARLKQLIANLLDQVDWLSLPVDVKGTIYEELLSRSAQESSRGAGQYFTPRPVIQAMCEVMQPAPGDRICDPAAGTGGFLCNAYQHVLDRYGRDLDRDELRALRTDLVEGMEISPKVGRMCAMNLYLHGIGGEEVVVHTGHDSLSAPWGREYSMVLANPPFGKKQSLLFVNEEGDTEKEDSVVVREDFWTSTSNKQLNFVQHIYSLLKNRRPRRGRAAGQRALRGRSGREGAPQPAGEVPRPHPAAAADRHLVLAGRQGQRGLLRQEGGPGGGLDRPAVGLRPAHQPALHAEAEADPAGGLRRLRGVLQARPSARAGGDLERGNPGRPLAMLRIQGAAKPGQAEPRPVLDQGREPDRYRLVAAARRDRRGDRRRPGGGVGSSRGSQSG